MLFRSVGTMVGDTSGASIGTWVGVASGGTSGVAVTITEGSEPGASVVSGAVSTSIIGASSDCHSRNKLPQRINSIKIIIISKNRFVFMKL